MNEINHLLDRIEMPAVDVGDDVTRGEQALRTRRRWQVSGVAASTVALVALVGVMQGIDGAPGSASGFADRGKALASQSPGAHHSPHHGNYRGSPDVQTVLAGYHSVLADHLDPQGNQLGQQDNWQGSTYHDGPDLDSVGSKFDWRGGGMLEVAVSTSWRSSPWVAWAMGGQHIQYQGHDARVVVDGSDISVAVEHEDGQVVELDASRTFDNNGTSTTTTGLTTQQLLAAAVDPRLTIPDGLH